MNKYLRKPEKKPGHPILGLCASAPFAGIAYVCKFVLPGYSFSFLVCLGIIAVILFYSFIPLVGRSFPGFARAATWVVSIGLCIGLLVAGITESFIIRASFGNPTEHADYMVVLGAKVRPDGPSVSLWDRINKAAEYMQEHPDVIAVVSGGQGEDEVMTEAQCMYNELLRKGIAPERIWLEERASSTDENMRFSLDLIEARTGVRPGKLAILSSEYHLFRAGLMAKKLGIGFVGVPARTSVITQLINHAMREIAGVWQFLLLGR